jgi:hypothetical protein
VLIPVVVPSLRLEASAFHPLQTLRGHQPTDGLAGPMFLDQMTSMNLDDQIRRYFGIADLAAVPPEVLNAGIEHMKVDLGLTKDRGERFALWALLHTLGSAPDLDVVFKTEAEREAARNFMDLIHGASGP